MSRGTFELERVFTKPIADVWKLWTTAEGLESWWGPEGFATKVLELDVRPAGVWRYAMTAVGEQQIEFMKRGGMPLTTVSRATYDEVQRHRRLAYTQLVDFVPGLDPYDVHASVDFAQTPQGVRMPGVVAAMPDPELTRLARMGWESQLEKLARRLG